MKRIPSILSARALLLSCVLGLALPVRPAAAQQLNSDKAAMMVLNSGRRAYNEGKYAFAAERFREFLRRYGGHREATSAHYGLALSLLAAPQRDHKAIIASLQAVVGRRDFPDRPHAMYYLGTVQRELGDAALARAKARPNEAPQHRSTAARHFSEADRSFAAAATAFSKRVKRPAATQPADLPEDLEWAARAQCGHCEMLLRAGKFKEAGKLAEAMLADAETGRSRSRSLALYHLGYAKFALKEYLAAGRALSQLAPFQQEFALHARYLLARTHHLAEERPEAAAQYKAVLADYETRKKAARQALRNPRALEPEQRASFTALVNDPPPEYLLRASFYLALLLSEEGHLSDAAERFTALLQKYPKLPIAAEARLRLGYCQMELRNFAEAIRTLRPLSNDPKLSDRAMWWLARAQVGGADPKDAQAYARTLNAAIDILRRAADQAGRLARTEPAAKVRRGDILMELADTQQLAKQYGRAAETYRQVLSEKNNPDRAEEAMQRQVTALHLAGQYRDSDSLGEAFERTYPKSTLLPAVLFRRAENTYLTAMAAAKDPNRRKRDVDRLFEEAIRRYERLLKRFPEFASANAARHAMAAAHCRVGRHAEAIKILSAIPEPDRTGELATVSYLLADCYIRSFPPETGDALEAARLLDRAKQAAKLLEGFLAVDDKSAEAPDALLKLGHCYQRIGAVLVDSAERKKTLTQAVQTYDRSLRQFARSPSAPVAQFERAKCFALLGDTNRAIGELRRFEGDPMRNSPVAPLALLRLSTLLRAQGKPTDAVNILNQCRERHEASLLKDPARSDWVALLHYEHALATKESGKLADAKAMFEALAKRFPGRPEAVNATWRVGQCRREELAAALAAARRTAAKWGAKPQEIEAARQTIRKGLTGLRQTVKFFQAQAGNLARKAAGSKAHLRVLYELAWCYRLLGEAEIEAARQKRQQDELQRVRAKLAKALGPGRTPPSLRPPEVALSAIPLQPMERAAREQYKRVSVESAGAEPAEAAPLGIQARVELAEMHARRADNDTALELLAEALGNSPPPELAQRIRLRLAASLLAGKKPVAALAQIRKVEKDAASPVAAEARYLAGEAYIQQRQWTKAIERLLPFRDHGPLQRLPELSDRALLRLGHAYAQAKQSSASRHTLQTLVQRFPQSPWVDEARYGIGRAWQSENQHDRAVNAYSDVIRRTVAEVAAKAQVQIGLCRLAQKRHAEAVKALLIVPFTYDYPEWQAMARCEAARAYVEMKQPAEAAKLWRKVLRDHPTSRWAGIARQSLKQIQ